MDINNYSYAPHLLDNEKVLNYSNDDMYIYIEKDGYGGFLVFACSYDGQLEVCETFRAFTSATALYNHIISSYSDTPPDDKELSAMIYSLHNNINEIKAIIEHLNKRTNPHNSKRYTRLVKQYNALKHISERKACLDAAFWRGVESCIKKGADLTFVI